MPTIHSGTVTTADVNSTSLGIDCSKAVAMLNPNQTLIYSILNILGKKAPAEAVKVEWDEDEYLPFKTTVNGAIVAGATSLVVDDGTLFKVNDVIRDMRTTENMLITAISANTLTVVRAYGTVSAAAVNDEDNIFRIGNVNEEGGDVLAAKVTQRSNVYNLTQIFKHDVNIAGSMLSQVMRSGESYKSYQEKKIAVDHALDIERGILFGQLKNDTANFTDVARQMRGIYHTISTNVRADGDGTLTLAEWNSFLEDLGAANGSGDRLSGKIVLIGSIISQALAAWGLDKAQVNMEAKKYGMHITEYMTPGGAKFMIKHHQLFRESSELKGMAMVIDPEQLWLRPLKNRDTKYHANLPTTADKYLGEYRTELSLEMRLEKNFALLTGITGYSV